MADTANNSSLELSITIPNKNNAPSIVQGGTIANTIPTEVGENPMYANIMISMTEWENRIHDMGFSKAELKVKRYKGSDISPYGPKEFPDYYNNLTSIAIDYLNVSRRKRIWVGVGRKFQRTQPISKQR